MSFSLELMEHAKPVWEKYLSHPFILGMRDGTLPREKFYHFLIQDTLYLREYVDISAYAFLKTKDIALKRELYNCMGLINLETAAHLQYLSHRGLMEKDALDTPKEIENSNYLNYMLNIAKNGTLAEAVVSTLPCSFSYHYIFSTILQQAIDNNTLEKNYYKEFIQSYGADNYFAIYKRDRALCDILCEHLSETEKTRMKEIFYTGSEYELCFWDMGYK